MPIPNNRFNSPQSNPQRRPPMTDDGRNDSSQRTSRRKQRGGMSRRIRKQLLKAQENMALGVEQIEQKIPRPLRKFKVTKRVAIAATILLAVGGGRLAYVNYDRSLPTASLLNTFVRRGTVTVKAVDGTPLLQVGDATRERVEIKKLPKNVVNAFIAAEDRRFYQHNGVDFQGIGRAIGRNILSGGVAEGGSTITQQVARMAFLNQDRSLVRKFKEAVLAQKLEREMDKDKLLEHYMNLVYLGSEAFGVGDAAWVYFSKPVDKLTLAETAMIAGLPPAPNAYSPLVNVDAAKTRRNLVLDRMVEQGFVSAADASTAKAEPVTLKQATPKNTYSTAPYFTDYVQQELPKLIGREDIEAGGLTVETTLNSRWQKAAEEAVRDQTGEDTGPEAFQGALVAVDPANGEIRALVGGKDYYGKKKADAKYKGDQFNRATQAMRQPGSTFKTFIYTAAVAAGFSPYKTYADERYVVDGYEPKNYGNSYSGSIDMRRALAKSANVVAVKVLIDVGFDPAIEMARKMGIESKLEPVYSMVLGSFEVNLLELTSSYGTLAAEGMHAKAHGIKRITNAEGKVLFSADNADFKPKRVIDSGTSSIMTWMLEGVVNNGTGGPASLPDRGVAGKTGTSEKTRDLWFVGYIPQLVAGVWLGYDDSVPTGGSSAMAADVWRQFMRDVTKDIPVAEFPERPKDKDMDDRKGSIKAKPVKPKSSYSKGIPSAKERANSEWDDRNSSSSSSSGSSSSGGGGGGGGYYDPPPAEEPRGGGGDYYAPEPAPAYEPPPAAPPTYYEPEPAAPAPEPAAPEPAAPPPEPAAPAPPEAAEPAPPN
jgi:penicillin-binding protein 1A